MKNLTKLLTLTLLVFAAFALPSEAKKYVMNITPAQEIYTKGNALTKGDVLQFTVTKDLYVDNLLFIAKDTPVNATVEFVEGDAWMGETPLMTLNYFETKDVTGDPVIIEYALNIKGKYGKSKVSQYAKYYAKSIIYCANLELKPNELEFNVLFDKDDEESAL